MSNEKREQQMMAAADAYVEESEEIYNIVDAITDFCAGWRAADSHPHWIPVEEELPKKEKDNPSLSVNVIVTDEFSVFESYYSFNTHIWAGTDIYGTITHWMPLPMPPQGKEE